MTKMLKRAYTERHNQSNRYGFRIRWPENMQFKGCIINQYIIKNGILVFLSAVDLFDIQFCCENCLSKVYTSLKTTVLTQNKMI